METIKKRPFIFLAMSGLATALPFVIPQLFMLSWISLIPLAVLLFDLKISFRRSIKYVLVFFSCFYLPLFIWFLWLYPLDFAGMSSIQSVLIVSAAWIGFSAVMLLPSLVMGPAMRYLRPRGIFAPFAFSSLWVILEWCQSWFLSGFTWSRLAVSQYQFLPGLQSASLFGTLFTGFLIALVNSLIALSLCRHTGVTDRLARVCVLAALCLFFVNAYGGMARMSLYEQPEETVKFGVVQGNYASGDKWKDGAWREALHKYTNYTVQLAQEGCDIVVWPESAITATVMENSPLYEYYNQLALYEDITLITGGFYIDDAENMYNAIIAASPDNQWITPYAKRHLVPFGEYLPFRPLLMKLFPFIEDINMLDDDLTAGNTASVLSVNRVKAGGLVCFDSIFSELARDSVRQGANVLVLVTNDSWYKDSPGIYQHNAQAVLRAVENGRYLVRAANTGVSSIIDPTGDIIESLPPLVEGTISADVGLVDNMTLYTKTGDLILPLCAAFILICVYFKYLYKIRRV